MPLDIAIVGGGVSGLTCAVVLKKAGVNAQIYESAKQFGEIGAGLGLGPNVIRIMETLGFVEEILQSSPDPGKLSLTGFRFVSGAEGHEHLYTYPAKPHEHGAGIHRASFLDILTKRIDPNQAHHGKRCTAIAPSPTNPHRQVMRFTDDTEAEADVVIVANGVKSKLREIVTGAPSGQNMSFANTVCYRGLVTREAAVAKGVDTSFWDVPSWVAGVGKHIIIYPISGGKLINIAAFVSNYDVEIGEANRPDDAPTSVATTTQELLDEYKDFGSSIRSVLGCMERPLKWYINVVYPHLPTYAKGRVALMGDAAHGMLPHLYAGAGQGIEDGYLLGRLLSHPQASPQNVEEILKVYDELRRPRSQHVWDLSYYNGKASEGFGPRGTDMKSVEQDLRGIQDFVWNYVVGEDVGIAIERLKERGAFV